MDLLNIQSARTRENSIKQNAESKNASDYKERERLMRFLTSKIAAWCNQTSADSLDELVLITPEYNLPEEDKKSIEDPLVQKGYMICWDIHKISVHVKVAKGNIDI
jgi:hypothetical protein